MVDLWVRLEGDELMFVNGENDPWGSEPFRISPWAGGNHGSNIARLAEDDRAAAEAVVKRWADVSPAPLDSYNPGLDRSLPF